MEINLLGPSNPRSPTKMDLIFIVKKHETGRGTDILIWEEILERLVLKVSTR